MTHDSTTNAERALEGVHWRKSSRSGTTECLVVAELDDDVAVRNSKDPQAGTVFLGKDVLAAWIKGCKAGEFDDLTS